MKSKKILIAFSITLLSTAILINNPHSVHAEIQLLGTIIVVGGVILGIRTLRKNHEN